MTTSDNETPQDSRRVFDLLSKAQSGDREAFGELYSMHYDTVFLYIYRRFSQRVVAEDLASDVFVRALQNIRAFRWENRQTGSCFAAWLVTIARNRIADYLKASRFRGEVLHDLSEDWCDRDHSPWGPSSPPAELAALGNIAAATVVNALGTLTVAQQNCISLRFLHELSVTETAEAMDHGEASVKTLQYRGIRALRRNPAIIGLRTADLS